jgi:hypothetical protein
MEDLENAIGEEIKKIDVENDSTFIVASHEITVCLE